MSQVYYITEFSAPKDHFKFQAQIESIFREKGFIPLSYPKNYFRRIFFIASLYTRLKKGDIIFFIHPLYARTSRVILRIARNKKSIPVCLVSDINSLRDQHVNFNRETGYWKNLRYFIFQNEKMRAWVENRFGNKRSVNLELFDLLFPVVNIQRRNSTEVVFAGNTEKCPFIQDLHKIIPIDWHVYSSTKVSAAKNLVFHESKPESQHDLRALEGSYGLIWEGESIENLSNFRGQYLTVVTPLKLSNYLLKGLPVITSREAAIADFVSNEKIGFCVDSLHDIPGRIHSFSDEEYNQMAGNAAGFANKIASGYYSGKAIDGILKLIAADQLS